MKITEVTSPTRTIALYPGRFQMCHRGHVAAYNWLRKKFGTAFVVTSNVTDSSRSPFDFQEKKALLVHAGVPHNAIRQVSSPYVAKEVTSKFDPDKTVVVFGVSQKDMAENPRFDFAPKRDGSLAYLQPYEGNQNQLQPFRNHAYVITIPTFQFDVLGQPVSSASEIRQRFRRSDDSTQQKIMTDLYGTYSAEMHNLIRSRLG